MKYVIYKLIRPSILEDKGYDPRKYRDVLEKLNEYEIEEEHPTMESAITEINNNKEKLRGMTLTIIPIISIGWID